MKANELRIGNYVNIMNDTVDDEYVKVIVTIRRNFAEIECNEDQDSFEYHEIQPIPITEEWLVKFGFNKCNYKTVYHAPNSTIFLLNGRAVKHYKRQDVEYFRMVREDVNIKYIHELQNLVFALTGVELTAEPAR